MYCTRCKRLGAKTLGNGRKKMPSPLYGSKVSIIFVVFIRTFYYCFLKEIPLPWIATNKELQLTSRNAANFHTSFTGNLATRMGTLWLKWPQPTSVSFCLINTINLDFSEVPLDLWSCNFGNMRQWQKTSFQKKIMQESWTRMAWKANHS